MPLAAARGGELGGRGLRLGPRGRCGAGGAGGGGGRRGGLASRSPGAGAHSVGRAAAGGAAARAGLAAIARGCVAAHAGGAGVGPEAAELACGRGVWGVCGVRAAGGECWAGGHARGVAWGAAPLTWQRHGQSCASAMALDMGTATASDSASPCVQHRGARARHQAMRPAPPLSRSGCATPAASSTRPHATRSAAARAWRLCRHLPRLRHDMLLPGRAAMRQKLFVVVALRTVAELERPRRLQMPVICVYSRDTATVRGSAAARRLDRGSTI